MNILAIETATPACAVGLRLANGDEVVRVASLERHHTESLVPLVVEVLSEADLGPRDVTRVVVDRGPGLFTGLRVGIATAVAFAQGIGAEIVGVTSLEMLALDAFERGVRGRVVSCVDARRGEVFVRTFELDGSVVALDEARVSVARRVVIEWATHGAPVTFTGDGAARYREDFDAVPNGCVLDELVPSVRSALALGARGAPQDVVVPLYLREADAVANFATRERPK